MPNKKSDLPILTIKDGETGGEKSYINRAYVRTALQGALIHCRMDGDVEKELERLIAEIEG